MPNQSGGRPSKVSLETLWTIRQWIDEEGIKKSEAVRRFVSMKGLHPPKTWIETIRKRYRKAEQEGWLPDEEPPSEELLQFLKERRSTLIQRLEGSREELEKEEDKAKRLGIDPGSPDLPSLLEEFRGQWASLQDFSRSSLDTVYDLLREEGVESESNIVHAHTERNRQYRSAWQRWDVIKAILYRRNEIQSLREELDQLTGKTPPDNGKNYVLNGKN